MTYRTTDYEVAAPPRADTVGETLARAADLIEQGWTAGAFRRGGGYCIAGAIMQAATGGAEPCLLNFPAVDAALVRVAHRISPGTLDAYGTVYVYNDDMFSRRRGRFDSRRRRHREVVRLVRGA